MVATKVELSFIKVRNKVGIASMASFRIYHGLNKVRNDIYTWYPLYHLG